MNVFLVMLHTSIRGRMLCKGLLIVIPGFLGTGPLEALSDISLQVQPHEFFRQGKSNSITPAVLLPPLCP